MKLFLVLATIGTLAAQTLPVAVPLDDHSNSTQTRPFAVVANAAALPTLGCVPNSYAVVADVNVLYHNTATGSCSWAVVVTGASSSGSATAVQTANGSGGFSDGGCTMTGSVLTCGTNLYFGGVCVAPGTIATPLAGSVNYFCDSTNSNHLTAKISSGATVDLQSGDATAINGVSLASLVTGLLKNTTGTGVPSIATPGTDYGLGTVTTVGFTGGLLSIANPTTTPAITVAGTSGGIPYFASSSTWATSAALAAHGVVIGGGAATAPTSTAAGTADRPLVSNGASADPTFRQATGVLASGFIATNEGTNSTSFVDLTTPDTVTFSCDATCNFIVQYTASVANATNVTLSCFSSVYIDTVQADDGGQAQSILGGTAGFAYGTQTVASWKATSQASGSHTVNIKHKASSANTCNFSDRFLAVTLAP